MKIYKLWIPMIIFGFIGGIAKLCDTLFNVSGIGFIVDSEICSAVFVASIVLVWLIGVIMLLADRKVEVALTPPKSKATGFFGFIAAVSVLGTGIISLFSIQNAESTAGTMIIIALSFIGGIVMLYESCISFTGHNGMKRFSLATLLLPAWACGRLIRLFIQYSKVSIHATEMFDVVSVTFLMLFLFYQAMLFAEIGPRTAVRRSTLYGICYVMCGLITTVDIFIKMASPTPEATGIDVFVVEPTLERILTCVSDLAFVLYAAAFVISNSRHAQIDRFEENDEDDDPAYFGVIASEPEKKKPEEIGRASAPAAAPKKKAAPAKKDSTQVEDVKEYKRTSRKTPPVMPVGRLQIEDEEPEQDLAASDDMPDAIYDHDDDDRSTNDSLDFDDAYEKDDDYDEIFRMLDEMGDDSTE